MSSNDSSCLPNYHLTAQDLLLAAANICSAGSRQGI
jgi:hypothetical protein